MSNLVRVSNRWRCELLLPKLPGDMRGVRGVRAKRVDANHQEIKRAFERMGCDVLDLSGVGKDCPDLLVRVRSIDRWILVEVKTPKGRLKPGQVAFAQRWPVKVVRTVDDAIEAVSAC